MFRSNISLKSFLLESVQAREFLLRQLDLSGSDLDLFQRLLRTLRRAGVTHAWVELPYIDLEFMQSYRSHYAAMFRDRPKSCWRVHFVCCEGNPYAVLGDQSQFLDPSGHVPWYRGFSVLRPLDSQKIGRTAICAEIDTGYRRYHLADFHNEVNLLGRSIRIRSVPFMQQDTQVSACASVALWIQAQSLGSRIGATCPTTADITQAAYSSDPGTGRAFPSGGLLPHQMVAVVESLGFDAIVLENDGTPYRLYREVCTYVESDLPVVLALAQLDRSRSGEPRLSNIGHAVTACGHTFGQPLDFLTRAAREENEIAQTSSRCRELVVHDDRHGPYGLATPISFDKLRRTVSGVPGEIPMDLVNPVRLAQDGAARPWFLTSAIVALPRRFVSMSREHALAVSTIAFETALSRSKGQPLVGAGYECRLFLAASNRFKESLRRRAGISGKAVEFYSRASLPKYVWICEFGRFGRRAEECALEIIGEVLLDASGSDGELAYGIVHAPRVWSRVLIDQAGAVRGLRAGELGAVLGRDGAELNPQALPDEPPYPCMAGRRI